MYSSADDQSAERIKALTDLYGYADWCGGVQATTLRFELRWLGGLGGIVGYFYNGTLSSNATSTEHGVQTVTTLANAALKSTTTYASGASNAIEAFNTGNSGSAVYGENSQANGYGIAGRNTSTAGSGTGAGVLGESLNAFVPGVRGVNDKSSGTGVRGQAGSVTGTGVVGTSTGGGTGVAGTTSSSSNAAISGSNSGSGPGVLGTSAGTGLKGVAPAYGVWGEASSGGLLTAGVLAVGSNGTPGLHAIGSSGSLGALFWGNVHVSDDFSVSGIKSFVIDDPAAPTERDLCHACVESSEPRNFYDGRAVADDAGEILVQMPAWFQAINRDIRYQLTPIGGAAPSLHVKEEFRGGGFRIAGANAGQEVCWQITGRRSDPAALREPFLVEREKPAALKGKYRTPAAYGQTRERAPWEDE